MSERIVFWYGCNVLRHRDIIQTCLEILRRLDIDARAAGGPDYCCGNGKDANLMAADGMARRTVSKFNAMERERVVAWCPSCLIHMKDFMGKAYAPEFSITYLVDVLHERREELAKLLERPVPMRVLVHKHVGFNDKSAVNRKVPELLRLVPGIEVIEDEYAAPGYMCTLLGTVPAAMADMVKETVRRVGLHKADALVTTFHQCYRELCGLERDAGIPTFNYMHLLARSMGLPHEDEYKSWKNAGAAAGSVIGGQRIEKVGVEFFERAMLPELVKKVPGAAPPKPDK